MVLENINLTHRRINSLLFATIHRSLIKKNILIFLATSEKSWMMPWGISLHKFVKTIKDVENSLANDNISNWNCKTDTLFTNKIKMAQSENSLNISNLFQEQLNASNRWV